MNNVILSALNIYIFPISYFIFSSRKAAKIKLQLQINYQNFIGFFAQRFIILFFYVLLSAFASLREIQLFTLQRETTLFPCFLFPLSSFLIIYLSQCRRETINLLTTFLTFCQTNSFIHLYPYFFISFRFFFREAMTLFRLATDPHRPTQKHTDKTTLGFLRSNCIFYSAKSAE